MALARGFQGFSSAAILVVGMALIKDAVGKERTGEGMGYSTVAIQSGLILGPSVGGILDLPGRYDKAGYEAVFILPAVLLAIDIFLRLMIIENGAAEAFDERAINAENSDSVGDSLVRPSDPDLTERTALLGSRNHEQSNRKTLWQRFPVLRLITHSRMVTALLVAALDVAIFSALETTIPLFVMRLFDWTPTKTGILFLATCTPGIILGYTVGKSIDRSGSLLPAAGGITIAATCLIAQRIVHENTLRDEIILVALFTASNISMLFVNITMSAEIGLVAQEVDEETGGGGMVGKGYALNMMACSGGQLLGPLIGGFMVEKTGWAGMTLLLGALCLAALPGILLFAGGGIIALHRKSLDAKGAENFSGGGK
ncbi:MAG: hypothetical protein M1836_004129 [Candelina mexicana]|nr:MAG: hypothetical protein M1836_004129 [Candelina mexicana]